MSTFKLLRSNAIPQVINKNFTTVATITGDYRQPMDIMNPVILIDGIAYQNNFIKDQVTHVEMDGHIYFVVRPVLINRTLVEIHLHMDVLTTYKEQIGNLEVILGRSDNAPNKNIRDDMHPVDSTKEYEYVDFPKGFSDQEEYGTYLLVTSQKGYTSLNARIKENLWE